MGRAARLAALLAAMVSVGAPAQEAGWTSDAAIERLRAEARRVCRSSDFLDLTNLAKLLAEGKGRSCRSRPELAVRIGRAMAGLESEGAAEGFRLLADLHAAGIGVPRDDTEALELRRRGWMLNAPFGVESPFRDTAESEAWLAQDQTVAFLRRYAGSERLPLLRARLARALFLRGEAAEAATIIAESSLLPTLRRAAIRRGAEPRDDLAFFARHVLGATPSAQDRAQAVAWLGDAAFAADSPYREVFFREVTRANGGVAPSALSGDGAAALRESLRPRLTGADYPPSALRNEEEADILLRGLLDPYGRLIFTEPASSDQPPQFVVAARRLYALQDPVDRAAVPAPAYVWIELPSIAFRIAE